MKQNCQHCGELIVGNAYRVTSEEEGMIMLNMVVAPSALWRRKDLDCIRRRSMLEADALPFEIEGVTVRDSKFNCGAGPFSTRRLARE